MPKTFAPFSSKRPISFCRWLICRCIRSPVYRIERQNDRALPPHALERNLVIPAVARKLETRGSLSNLCGHSNILLATFSTAPHSTLHSHPRRIELRLVKPTKGQKRPVKDFESRNR